MSDYQIADTVDLILEEYPHYKLDDYKLFFKMAKKGYFGQIFGRIDGEVVLSWLKKYDEQRCVEAQNIAIKEKEKINIKGLCYNIGVLFVICGLIWALAGFSILFRSNFLTSAIFCWICICIINIIAINKFELYKK